MLTNCTQAASNLIAADACQAAMQHAVAASPTVYGLALAGAIAAAAIFATIATRVFFD